MKPVSFNEALGIVEAGFETWREKPHNAKWFKLIDGTPIPNDLMVNIAEAICHSTLSAHFPEQRGPMSVTRDEKIKCDECGKFIAFLDLVDGKALHHCVGPSSEFSDERFESLCAECYAPALTLQGNTR